MSRRVLVLFGSTYGHTATIARRIGAVLEAHGNVVTLRSGDAIPRGTSPRDFDGVVIGASVIAGRHQRSVRAFARTHHRALNDVPSACFSVSASAASFDEHGRSLARACLARFLHQTGWYPALTESIAGAIRYTRYDAVVRWWMRRICARAGGPTDTSRDHELTDWAQVDRFAGSFAALLERVASHEPPAWAVRREQLGPRTVARR